MRRPAAAMLATAMFLGAAMAQEDAPGCFAPGPDHLTPAPFDYARKGRRMDRYFLRLYEVLDVRRIEAATPADMAVLIVQPPFAPESCLVLVDRGARGGELTYRVVDRNVWFAMPENRADGEDVDPRRSAEGLALHGVQTFARPLDATRTRRILRLWARVLRDGTHPGPGPLVEDDVRYTFRIHRERLYGEAGGSSSGAAAASVRVGEALIAISRARPSGRARALRELDRECEALEARLDASSRPHP